MVGAPSVIATRFSISAWARRFAVLAAISILATLVPVTPGVSALATPTVRLVAASDVEIGKAIQLEVELVGAVGVGGYEALVLYDTTRVRFNGLTEAPTSLKGTGRGLASLGPVERNDGVAFGAYSCLVPDCTSASGSQSTAGASGTVSLGQLELVPTSSGFLEFALGPVRVVDTVGRPIRIDSGPSIIVRAGKINERGWSAPAAQMSLSPDLAAFGFSADLQRRVDVTGDGKVTNGDARTLSVDWELARYGDGACSPTASSKDISGDGCLDVSDVQLVAALQQPSTEASGAGADLEPLALTDPAFIVDTVADAADATPGDGICQTSTGACSLRAAITEANARSGADLIQFAIPGSGVQTIALGSALPALSDASGGTTIDGYTQLGSSPNTHATQSNAILRIAITGGGDGSDADDRWPAFTITEPFNVIRGVSIYQVWRKVWMSGSGARDNLIAGSFIGTNPTATYASSEFIDSSGGGIAISGTAHDNQIGEATLAGRNVISGNQRSGIIMSGLNVRNNVIRNNIIGLSPDGSRRMANVAHGIDAEQGTAANTIGGTGINERNVLSGNSIDGIEVVHLTATANNRIIGNFVGTDLTGNAAPPFARNGGEGISIDDGPQATIITDNVVGNNGAGGITVIGNLTADTVISRNRVGISLAGTPIPNELVGILAGFHAVRTTIGPENVVAFNPVGVLIPADLDNDFERITRNAIHDNDGLGIDVDPPGVNPNLQYSANGPNQHLPFPALTSATTSTVAGRACGSCTVEIFVSDSGANQFGEGEAFVGSAVAATSGLFTATVSGVALGNYVTATATDANGNSSEFSLNRQVTASGTSAPGTVFARDEFERTVSAGWGTAGTGGPWTVPGVLTSANVNGGRGSIQVTTAGQTRLIHMWSTSERDVDIRMKVALDKLPVGTGSNAIPYFELRRADNGNEYRARARIAPDGRVWVHVSRVTNNVESAIGGEVLVTGLTLTAGSSFWLRADVIGSSPTTLRVKAWADGAAEPGTWAYAQSNSEAALQGAGSIGIRAYVNTSATNMPITFFVDGLRANVPVPDDGSAPAAPQGVTATAGNNSVALAWTANTEADLAGYRVYRSTSLPVSTSGTPISGTEPIGETNFVDTSAVNGTAYFYVVTAVDLFATSSAPSATASATPDAAAGTGLDFDGVDDHVTFGAAPSLGRAHSPSRRGSAAMAPASRPLPAAVRVASRPCLCSQRVAQKATALTST